MHNKDLPPGPPGLPFIGNVYQLSEMKWLTFSKWNKEYGPIFHLNLAGKHTIILGSKKIAIDLFDRRAAIYSGRPKSIMIDIVTGGLSFAFGQYTEKLKPVRKAAHKALSNDAAKRYQLFQESESVVLISQLLGSPTEFDEHLNRASNSLVLSVLYGQTPIVSSSDQRVNMISGFTHRITMAGSPGQYLVEFFTWMRFLPRWMCKWKTDSQEWFFKDSNMAMGLTEDVKNRMINGIQKPCFVSSLLENNNEISRVDCAWTALTLYAAGAHIVSGQMSWLMLAILLHPEAQTRAQEELDHVVGRERLPNFGDYESLIYVQAIVKECIRWRPVAPLGKDLSFYYQRFNVMVNFRCSTQAGSR
ncbi:cytochrome P450 [Cyathus striatus]|nr:cytochrome P450 [Cyathus striatus]